MPALNWLKLTWTVHMPWILLLLAIASFGLTFMHGLPFGITLVLLLMALGFLLAAILSFLSERLQSNSRDDTKMISPEELRMMREQAAARKAASEDSQSNSAS